TRAATATQLASVIITARGHLHGVGIRCEAAAQSGLTEYRRATPILSLSGRYRCEDQARGQYRTDKSRHVYLSKANRLFAGRLAYSAQHKKAKHSHVTTGDMTVRYSKGLLF